jgi:hypothetical protein
MMVVRAARSIAKGEEVTITYAGALASSPLPVRRCEGLCCVRRVGQNHVCTQLTHGVCYCGRDKI